MKAPAKVAIVAGGYVAALLAAFAVVAVYVASTSGPARDASSGMYAFGDSLLFLAVFGIAAVPATGAALFFLRPHRRFWPALGVTALLIAATGVAAAVEYLMARGTMLGPSHDAWPAFAVLRILVAPLFALAFFLSGLFAPSRSPRIALFAATLIEAASFSPMALLWFQSR